MWTRFLAINVVYVIAALSDLEDPILDKAGVKETHSNLMAYQDEIKASLALTTEEKKSLRKRLKILEQKYNNPVLFLDDSIEDMNAIYKVGKYLYQGDIVLTRSQVDEILNDIHRNGGNRLKRQAFVDLSYPKTVWQNSRMAYFFDKTASERLKGVFRKAAMAWRENTCIDIYEDTCGVTPDRIRVSMRDGCWSHVGRIGGEQVVSLGHGCESFRYAAHELRHALGLYHAHARQDRDQYITINVENIKKDWVIQFNKRFFSYNYDVPYDVGSIMHYGSTSSSVDRKKRTMIPKDVLYTTTLGSHMISFYDYLILNRHYNCTDRCKLEDSAHCGIGFPNPRNCRTCICPSGYGGRSCHERPAGCGKTLAAEPYLQLFGDSVGDEKHGYKLRLDFDMCHYWITAPAGRQIEVKILEFSQSYIAADGCKYGGVEIKTQADQRLTGYRFCSIGDISTVLISNNNIVPIITFNRLYQLNTVFQYRYL